MTILYLLIIGVTAGTFGALLGLGGGFIVIPVLTLLFNMPIQTAIGISLIGVIATSTGAAIGYVREGKADIRLGMVLELATTIGAIIGAIIAAFISAKTLYLLFSGLLLYNAYSMYRKRESEKNPEVGQKPSYQVRNVPAGLALSGLAGIMSGLLGIGGGLIKIPVMYTLMGVPLKTAVATSNFMIGVTAAASASVYYFSGNIYPAAAVPVAIGVFAGANIGLRLSRNISVGNLKKIFVFVFLYVAVQMIVKGIGS